MTDDVLPQEILESHAERLLHAAYAGILGREPDPEGLASHCAHLRQEGRLVPVLADIAGSEEAWRRSVGAHAPQIVGAVFRALLGREPEEEARAVYAELLARTGELELFLSEVARSKEHATRVLAEQGLDPDPPTMPATSASADPRAIVEGVFRGLLGRAPDAEALAAYTRLLAETGDLASFIAEVDRSTEHRRRMLLQRG